MTQSTEEKAKTKILVFLRGGQTVEVLCTDWEFTRSADGGYSEYSFKGVDRMISFRLEAIDGYTVVE